jgi:hypothetical protein
MSYQVLHPRQAPYTHVANLSGQKSCKFHDMASMVRGVEKYMFVRCTCCACAGVLRMSRILELWLRVSGMWIWAMERAALDGGCGAGWAALDGDHSSYGRCEKWGSAVLILGNRGGERNRAKIDFFVLLSGILCTRDSPMNISYDQLPQTRKYAVNTLQSSTWIFCET